MERGAGIAVPLLLVLGTPEVRAMLAVDAGSALPATGGVVRAGAALLGQISS